MKKSNLKLNGKLKSYLQIPLLLGFILALVDVWIYLIDIQSGIILSIFVLVYLVTIIMMMSISKPSLMNELVSFATEYGQIQKQLLKNLELPHALLDESGKLIWMNKAFEEVTGKELVFNKDISTVFRGITKDKLPQDDNNTEIEIEFAKRNYRVQMKRVGLKDMAFLAGAVEEGDEYNGFLIAIYLYDETAYKVAIEELDKQSLVVGFIYIDNYEEALESVEDVAQSMLSAFIDRTINQYVSQFDGIVRKIEKDKFLLIMRKSSLEEMKEERFKILEDVKSLNMGNETAVTLSIGIGHEGLTYLQSSEFARNAIDLALGRGGDQVVVKSSKGISYYGGKSQQKESNTRVKARVKAQALQEIISTREQVFVMGHRNGDVDSFGASVGIRTACKALNRECHIVLDTISTSLKPLVDLYKSLPDYDEDDIVTGQDALEMVDSNSVLVIVDVNKPSITECPDLIRKCKTIVVLDHHRQGTEIIENPTLDYVEPYASSACEMVAEILQYINSGIKLKSIVADCLYSGIVVDTQNFEAKTGVRTFEAAAFLRRNGADVTRVRKMFRENATEYLTKADTVRSAEIYHDVFAISYCNNQGIESPTVIAAQAANELLNIKGIKGSFVLCEFQNKVYISARSIDEVNVQIIMERMGGGGHMSIAGTQLESKTVEEATDMLKETIDTMMKEGAI